jgi:hypothetical protein
MGNVAVEVTTMVKRAKELPAVSIPRNDQLDFSNKHKNGASLLSTKLRPWKLELGTRNETGETQTVELLNYGGS